MFIANDSNYTFGQFLSVVSGDDIKAPVYSKCFTDTEALKGYRFIHDPEETDPEKCVCFSIYDDVSSEATSTAFGKDAVISDLTSVSFRLDTKILDSGKVREEPYYHVIVPVQNIADDTLKYLVIKMTKEVELFPENYPYYELVSTFADAEPTSAEAPGSVTPTGTITITENDTYDVTNYASAEVNVPVGDANLKYITLSLMNTGAEGSGVITYYGYGYSLSADGIVPEFGFSAAPGVEIEIHIPIYKQLFLNWRYFDNADPLTASYTDCTYDSDNAIIIITDDCRIAVKPSELH